MFTFSALEYKWCPQCGGNIRKEAHYCRFCKKAIGSKLLQEQVSAPFVSVDDASMWLPQFNTLITKISGELLDRFNKADADSPPGTIGVPEGVSPMDYRRQNRECGICPHQPPEPHTFGLIYDILLSLHQKGEPLGEICAYPHLQLLELTPQEVAAEVELRKAELDQNHRCTYCSEFIFPADDDCRFCGGSAEKKPRPKDTFFDKEIDKPFLKDVILYETVWRTICGTTPLPKEILDANGITQANIDHEILRQRSPEAHPPMPRFCKRMMELNLTSYWSPESLSISALVELGSALDRKKVGRQEEALIVYEHGLKRTEDKEDLMHERGRILDYLALLYQGKDDFENYKKYHAMGKECKMYGMPDEMKELINLSDMQQLQSLTDGLHTTDDPAEKLAKLNELLGDSTNMFDKVAEQMDSIAPGLTDMMNAITGKIAAKMDSSRLLLEAEVAKKNGDLAGAEEKYKDALSTADGDMFGSLRKSALLCSLAEVESLQGNKTDAETHLKEALAVAIEYAEVMPDFGKSSIWTSHLAYANFLRDEGRHAESEESFKSALQFQAQSSAESMERFGGNREQFSGELALIKENYAKLLRALNRNDEAEKLEQQVLELKQEAQEETRKLQEHRSKMAQEYKDILDSQ